MARVFKQVHYDLTPIGDDEPLVKIESGFGGMYRCLYFEDDVDSPWFQFKNTRQFATFIDELKQILEDWQAEGDKGTCN